MTDKEKIIELLKSRMEKLQDSDSRDDSIAYYEVGHIIDFIKALPEEPVSEELEESACSYVNDFMDGELGFNPKILKSDCKISDASDELEIVFKAGAQWQKEKVKRLVDRIDVDNHDFENLEDLYDTLCEMTKY